MPEPETPDEPTPGDDTGRTRLLSALLRPSRAQVVVGLLLAVVGYAGVAQVRVTEVDDAYAGLREQDLIVVLSGLADASDRAQAEIARLESTRADLQSDTDARQAALVQAETEADALAILAGLVPVTGPGIRITIRESEGLVDIQSLLDTVQQLRTTGAEAIQINGRVRLVAQSAFEHAGDGIIVDGQVLFSPYVIDVIGPPIELSGALTFPQGPRSDLEDDGATVDVDVLESLDIESVRDPVEPEYAQPAPEQ